jgi:predicted NACHT family NTPase
VVPFESLDGIPCLALLGEPGIGKTHAMQAERKAIDTKIEKEGGQTLWLDLRSYGSEDRLVRNLFETTTFASWAKGIHRLHLFLDSLDECLLRIDTLSALLIDEFKKYPIERLYLRIACRTADWPKSLEDGLRQLWGDDAVGVYELAPLHRVDVIEAAKANDLAPEAFLREIDRMEVVPLAIKPVTLDFLLNTYRRNRQLPSTQAELYLQGCRLLCEETSDSRREARLTGVLTAEQRMAVAARIAAVIVFANRYAIWTGLDRGDVPEEDTTIQELSGGSEGVDDEQFQVTQTAVKETVATGLFSSRGPSRMGWAHQTYAEFLAARYLVEHTMTITQMMGLIVHPGDPDGKIVPQLHEPAAWLAGMTPAVFRAVMRVGPEVLLRSDVATADVKDRAALVETLLRLYDEERLSDRDLDIRLRYRKLAHPDLAEQLRPYICDDNKGVVVRRAAIDIAEACELQTLQDDLADIALDPYQPLAIREKAAYAVGRIGDDATKAKLKLLATGQAGEDPDDELKGRGLWAVWPGHMTVEELFAVLTPPKRPNLLGVYRMFLSSELVRHLRPPDLPTALKWVAEQGARPVLPDPFDELMDAIMLQGWEHVESPGVIEAFAEAALTRLKHHDQIVVGHHDPPFRSAVSGDDDKRRRVLEEIVPLLSDPEKDSTWLVYSRTPLVMSKDVPWMIERFQAAKSREIQLVWIQLIETALDWNERSQLDAVLIASQKSPLLADAFAWLFKPVELDSPEAQKMKEDYLKRKEWEERDQGRPLLEPPPPKRIAALLDACESGNSAAWWRLNREMTLEPDSTHYLNELESDLTLLPGWKTADAATRLRIVEAAKGYLLEQDPDTNSWLGTNTFHFPTAAGYRALRLLLQDDPGFVSTIPADVWKRWAPIILAYPTSGGIGDEEPHRELVKLAYQHSPDEIIQTLMIMIDKENEEGDHIFITRKVEYCWDDRLANALLNKAKDEKLKPECMGCLLGDLLDHQVREARGFAESLLPLPPPSGGDSRPRALVAARVLMTHAEDVGWSAVWPAIQQDAEFGQEVISAVAQVDGWRAASVGRRLTEDRLADLYVWLVRHYPYAEDPIVEQVHWVGPRESVARWRDSILGHLKERGTAQACEAIRRIGRELPELDWLKWTLLEAQNIARRRTWMPPRPRDILKMSSNQQARLVQSGYQLLVVLIESLRRLEEKLQGETPAVVFLWDRTSMNAPQPKDENSFSDYVKIHLDEELRGRGVIVNREVQIHRGERTDIHVDAVIRDPRKEVYDSVTAIIEVKGCWNPELNREMETQLMDRYLKDNRCQYGLYLVGWFNCGKWDDTDYRKQRAPKLSKDEAQEQFDAQAVQLSQQGMRIKALVVNTALP